MKQNIEQVKKLVETYLNVECIHNTPFRGVRSDIISTYDGDYPLFIIEYSSEEFKNDREQKDELTEGIEKYTNLKVGKDYWLGIEWSWNL